MKQNLKLEVEVTEEPIERLEFEKLIDEWAEVVYISLCQLQTKNQNDGSSISNPITWEKEDARAA